MCAHEDICYSNKSQVNIQGTVYHTLLEIPKTNGEYVYGQNYLFSLVIILKRLLKDSDFNLMLNELNYEIDFLAGKLHSINIDKVLDQMGFPLNYRELGRMK